jgi:hypothetical protein
MIGAKVLKGAHERETSAAVEGGATKCRSVARPSSAALLA